MFSRLRAVLVRRQALAFLENIHGWRRTTIQVMEICGQALHDTGFPKGDIGVSLDKIDRLLFQLRDCTSGSRSYLRRQESNLAHRFVQASNHVFELRNETARFLIRSQGPDLLSGKRADSPSPRQYYEQALQDSGFKARQMHRELERELTTIWDDLQAWIDKAEETSQ